MPLPETAYTKETLHHPNGQSYAVINTKALDFTGPDAGFGRKTRPIKVKIAKPGEMIYTQPDGHDETPAYVATGGECIFINDTPDGAVDTFVPRDAAGTPIGFAILEAGYTLIGGDIHGDGAFYRPVMKQVPILHEAIDRPSVIKNAYGEGQHAFLNEGATLKLDNGNVSGIAKAAFDFTWVRTDAQGRNLDNATREIRR